MPELKLLQLVLASVRGRLAQPRLREAGALSLELVAIVVILVLIAGFVFAILRAKAEQAATRITLP
jgi:hypothetical protein